MDTEEALKVANAAVFAKSKKRFTDLQELIFRGSWQGQKYDEIAEIHRYEPPHIKNEGSKLWKLLTEALGEKVSKTNFQSALKRRSHSVEVPQPQESTQEETPSKNTDFVGREDALNDLDNFVNQGAKVILIQAEGGVGKTTLAWEWFKRKGLELLELRVGRTPQNIQSAEDWVRLKLQDSFKENPERHFPTMLEQLKAKLQTQKIGVLIDNLEPALINGEFIEPHQSYYVELLTVLANPSVQSITLVTSRERLHEHEVIRLPTVRTYPLEPLKEKEWKKYFHNRNISINVYALSEMYQAYGGNAEVMYILAGDIQQQFWKGNLKAYWQQNHDDLLRHRSLKSLVKRQFNKLAENNRQAYKLLCRLAFYPERDVPFVPNAWLRCLLWDVPEKHRQQVINDLCDRSLVKVSDEGYYLHAVIRAEAIERLNLIPEASSEYLILIKKQVDLLIAQDWEIQKALSWISQKFNLVSKCYKKAAFRAFYLGCVMQYVFETISHTVDNEYKNFEIAYLLENDFLRTCSKYAFEKGYQEGKEFACQELNAIIEKIKEIFKEKATFLKKDFEWLYQKAVEKYLMDGYNKYIKFLNKFDEEEQTKNAETSAAIHFELTLKFYYKEEEIEILQENGKFNWSRNEAIQSFITGYVEGAKTSHTQYVEDKKITIEEYKNRLLSNSKDLQLKLVELARTNRLLTIPDKTPKRKAVNSQRNESEPKIICSSNEEIINDFQTLKNEFKLHFRDEQKKLLKQYYDMNRLLVYCLNSAVDKVRSHIEDTLLLPINEIREIEKQIGIK